MSATPEPQPASTPPRRTALYALGGLAACAVGAASGYWWLTRGAASGEEARLLAASFPDLEGRERPISEWRGKTLVVNFWATWCGPCREEMPEFVQAQNDFADRGLQLLGIAIDRPAPVERFARELGVNYPILLGDPAWLEAVKTMGNPQGVLPFTLVFAPDQSLKLRRVGRLHYDELAALIR